MKNHVILARMFLLASIALSALTAFSQSNSLEHVSSRGPLALTPRPSLSTQPVSQSIREGQTATFTVTPSGTGPFTYQWRRNGTNLSNLITTIAGTGEQGYSGDGGPAVEAALYGATSLAEDSVGNIFFLDPDPQDHRVRVRKIGTNGIITTVAGNGTQGFSGDGGPATNAWLSASGIAIDSHDTVFIVESARIRKIDTNGTITTIIRGDSGAPRNGFRDARSLAFDNDGNFVIADFFGNRVQKIDLNGRITTLAGTGLSGFSGDGGSATNARFRSPIDAVFDASRNLLIADLDNMRVRKVDRNGMISTVAGNGREWHWGDAGDGGVATNANIGGPASLAVDNAGNLFIGGIAGTVRKVGRDGIISIVAGSAIPGGSGPGHYASDAQFYGPTSVAVARNGDLLVADYLRIYRVSKPGPSFTLSNLVPEDSGRYDVVVSSPSGSMISQPASLEVLFAPKITAQPIDQALVAGTNAVIGATVEGTGPLAYQWYVNGQPLLSETNNQVNLSNIAFESAGNYQLVITNLYGSATSRVARVSVGIPPAITLEPASQTLLPANDALFTAQASGTGPLHYQWQFNGTNLPNFYVIAGLGAELLPDILNPGGVAFDPRGNLLIADGRTGSVLRVTTNGSITTVADGYGPIAVDSSGNIFIGDLSAGIVRRISPDGIMTIVAGGGTNAVADGAVATNVYLGQVGPLAIDSSENLFISDSFSRVFKIGTDGRIAAVAGKETFGFSGDGGPATEAELYLPTSLAVDRHGALFIADSANHRVRKVETNGVIETVAGNGTFGAARDGAIATGSPLFMPSAIAVDSKGNLIIADWYWTGDIGSETGYIHKVGTNGIISSVAGVYFPAIQAIAVDNSDHILVADMQHSRVVQIIEFGPTLWVPNVGPANSGTYNLVVTSPFGTTTSSPASLNVLRSASITLTGPNQLLLKFITVPNTTSILQWTANLTSPVQWSASATNTANSQGQAEFHLSISPGEKAAFYRLAEP